MQIKVRLAVQCMLLTAATPIYSWLIQTPKPITYHKRTSLYGIKGFRSWFESTFPNAMTELENANNSQSFDHVLIDMNQLLHVSLRRARNEDHGLALMIKKLDSYIALAKPQRSLVLAFDGPPSAAKMTTQRKRRLGIYLRSNRTELDRYSGLSEPKYNKKRRKSKEGATICITPGTKFMQKAKDAVLFWAWQRMSNKYTPLGSYSRVKVYISTSDVPGEGEVKLLDWLFHCSPLFSLDGKIRNSVAILGGDSDLVLEALVLPPQLAHDVFVILPHENRRSIVVSLWETTRYLMSFLTPNLVDLKHITSLRTDLVLLFILNGNDYLSKIRGSSGFQKLLKTYLKLLQRWITRPPSSHHHVPFLLTPDLEFNIPFCIAFFRELAKQAPDVSTLHEEIIVPYEKTVTPLSVLYQLADAGYLPRPATFHVKPSPKTGQQLVILTLGEDVQHYFELKYPLQSPLKSAKHQLAETALQEILNIDYPSLADDALIYPWEIPQNADCHISSYLYGLLWNLQTYKDGVCTDYSYNYGKRLSPTAGQIVSFLKNVDGLILSRDQLLWNDTNSSFVPPLEAGLSAIAALPCQAKDLVSFPHSLLLENSTFVETLYADCMNGDSVFDLTKFEKGCSDALSEILTKQGILKKDDTVKHVYERFNTGTSHQNGRSIHTSSKHWTVFSHSKKALEHPFEPPPPFCDGLNTLRPNRFIRVTRHRATLDPRSISHRVKDNSNSIFSKYSLYEIPYLKAYSNATGTEAKPKKKKHRISQMLLINSSASIPKTPKLESIQQPEEIVNKDGLTPLSILYCLLDSQSLSPISKITFEFHPHSSYEVIKLILQPDSDKAKIVFDMNRDLNHVSRKAVKQNLASLALIQLFGKEWTGLSLNSMKSLLID